MEFLVQIEVHLPPDLAPAARADLIDREAVRGRELKADGTIVRIWRIPGRQANVGIWDTADATALHAALCSLPMWPYLTADVTPLATHPLED